MKRFLRLGLPTLILIALVFCACFACTDGRTQPIAADRIAFEIAGENVTVTLIADDDETEEVYSGGFRGRFLDDLIYFLAGKDVLAADSSDSGYGAFFTQIGSLKQNEAEGSYLYFYTNLEDFKDITDYAATTVFGETALTSVNAGASDLPLSDGAVYLVGLIKF